MSLINVSNLTFSYEGSYDNIFENVSFQIDTDWKLGFIGRNGRGKTTFLNLLLGKYAYSGNISSTVKFEYFPYDVLCVASFNVPAPYLPSIEPALAGKVVQPPAFAQAVGDRDVPVVHRVPGETGNPCMDQTVVIEVLFCGQSARFFRVYPEIDR